MKFNPMKREDGKGFSHAEGGGGGTTGFWVVFMQ